MTDNQTPAFSKLLTVASVLIILNSEVRNTTSEVKEALLHIMHMSNNQNTHYQILVSLTLVFIILSSEVKEMNSEVQ